MSPLASGTTYPRGTSSARQGAGKRRDASVTTSALNLTRVSESLLTNVPRLSVQTSARDLAGRVGTVLPTRAVGNRYAAIICQTKNGNLVTSY